MVDLLWVVHFDHASIWHRYEDIASQMSNARTWTRKERRKKEKRRGQRKGKGKWKGKREGEREGKGKGNEKRKGKEKGERKWEGKSERERESEGKRKREGIGEREEVGEGKGEGGKWAIVSHNLPQLFLPCNVKRLFKVNEVIVQCAIFFHKISLRVVSPQKSDLWCIFLLWSLPFLLRLSC